MLTCAQCDTEFNRRPTGPPAKYCSAKCRARANYKRARTDGRYEQWCAVQKAKFVPKPETPRACEICKIEFMSNRPDKLCSDECRRLHYNRRMNAIWHRRRAITHGAEAEQFDPREIFERDDFVCHMCGVKTDPDANRYDPLKTTLDHVIPLARGGTHTRDNVRCACRKCNITIGAKPKEVTHVGASPEEV